MTSLRIYKLASMLVAVAFASAALLVSAGPANAKTALFRIKQHWWFSQAESWTDGNVVPTSGMGPKHPGSYLPPAQGLVGTTSPHPAFTVPKSVLKNTTYTWKCGVGTTGTFMCYIGYPKSSGWYSYWNGQASFEPQHANNATTTTTVRVRTTSDGYLTSIMGWKSTPMVFGKGNPKERTVSLPIYSPTAMGSRLTPTEGGCTGTIFTGSTRPIPSGYCPGTTQFDGLYTASRGGSIMIWPGSNRFGGTMRFFSGPNSFYYQLVTISGPYTRVSWPPTPYSLQLPTNNVKMTIGTVDATPGGKRYRLTDTNHTQLLVTGLTPSGGACTSATNPPNHSGLCQYYVRSVRYLGTHAPYTTGKVREWQPNGNTNTLQTTTGYDNRTAMGLNGTISMVQPTLVHAYLKFPSSGPTIKPILMSWSSARLKKMDYRFLPEPAGVAMLAAGFVTMAGLSRLRRR